MILDLLKGIFGKHHENPPDFLWILFQFLLGCIFFGDFCLRIGIQWDSQFLTNSWDNIFGSLFPSIEESQIQVIVKSFSLRLGNLGVKMIPNLPVNGTKNQCHSQVLSGELSGVLWAGSGVICLWDGSSNFFQMVHLQLHQCLSKYHPLSAAVGKPCFVEEFRPLKPSHQQPSRMDHKTRGVWREGSTKKPNSEVMFVGPYAWCQLGKLGVSHLGECWSNRFPGHTAPISGKMIPVYLPEIQLRFLDTKNDDFENVSPFKYAVLLGIDMLNFRWCTEKMYFRTSEIW